MDAQAAARSGDEIAHGVGMAAMIGGALLGAVAGAALVVATAATGGVAAVIVAGAVAGGGLSVGSLVKGLSTICNLPEPSSGVLMAGSLNVWVNSRAAQRASLDMAAVCSGFPMNHYPLPMPLVAEGSASVFINGYPAARLSSKLICGAHIKSASPNVTWGGPTVRTDAVFDREEWLRTGLQGLGVLALVGGCLVGSFVGAVITAGAFVIGNVVFGALRQWGDSIGPGYADLFEGVAGIALLAGGARAAAKAKMPAVAEGGGGGAKGEVPEYVTVFRGDKPGTTIIKSNAAREGGYAHSQKLINEGNLDDLFVAHAADSTKPASPFISVTTDKRVAEFFAGPSGVVNEFRIPIERATPNPFNDFYVPAGPGGKLIPESELLVPNYIRPSEFVR